MKHKYHSRAVSRLEDWFIQEQERTQQEQNGARFQPQFGEKVNLSSIPSQHAGPTTKERHTFTHSYLHGIFNLQQVSIRTKYSNGTIVRHCSSFLADTECGLLVFRDSALLVVVVVLLFQQQQQS